MEILYSGEWADGTILENESGIGSIKLEPGEDPLGFECASRVHRVPLPERNSESDWWTPGTVTSKTRQDNLQDIVVD